MVSESSIAQNAPSTAGHLDGDAGQCLATGSSSGGPSNPLQQVQYGELNPELSDSEGEDGGEESSFMRSRSQRPDDGWTEDEKIKSEKTNRPEDEVPAVPAFEPEPPPCSPEQPGTCGYVNRDHE